MKRFWYFFFFVICLPVHAGENSQVIDEAQQVFESVRIVCSGLSDKIAKVANISKTNTAITAAGTVASGGALATGIAKSKTDQEIDELVKKICEKGGCTAQGVKAMSDEQFFEYVVTPMAEIAELQQKMQKSKELGDWRTGLLAGTIGTNLASAILSGINTNQSDLMQNISACNAAMIQVANTEQKSKAAGINPAEFSVIRKLADVKTWCGKIDLNDIEKIENRMKGVMGTSVAGVAIGAVGVGTSAAANSDKYTNMANKINQTEQDRKRERALNTTANVMSAANVATGAVETGLNISLITLTKKLIKNAERCEEVFE